MMASTRSPSPDGNASNPSSPQLTPRSKLKALLAQVDENSDDDNDVSGPIDMKSLLNSKPSDLTSNHVVSGDDASSSEEEQIVRPRGRFAARMRKEGDNEPTSVSKTPEKSPRRPGKLFQRPSANTAEDSTSTRAPRSPSARASTPDMSTTEQGPPSPGLFVSPAPSLPEPAAGTDSDDDLPSNPLKNDRFKALVAKKREERLAREKEEEQKKQERADRFTEQLSGGLGDEDDDVSDISDDEGGRKLTQEQSRPGRKASKKALEEMHRETQRLNRSLQLAHEAKTKKKMTKASLFERFNFRQETPAKAEQASSSRLTSPISAHHTDAEAGEAGTPPSSPPSATKPSTTDAVQMTTSDEAKVISVEGQVADVEIQDSDATKLDKGKGVATVPMDSTPTKPTATRPKRQFRVKMPAVRANLMTLDSDDDLQITNTKKGIDSIFDKLPSKKSKDSNPMDILQNLANLSSPPKESTRGRAVKSSMTVGELQLSLQQRARAQAKLERERRVEFLRSKGIQVQSEEERAKEREQIEDIVSRARQEAEELMEREREDAKKERKERKKNGEADPLGWDDSDDDDDSYQGSEEDAPEDIDLSGSEDEDVDSSENEDAGELDDAQIKDKSNLLDSEAEDAEPAQGAAAAPAQAEAQDTSDDEMNQQTPVARHRRSTKRVQILSDDEEDEQTVQATPKPKKNYTKSPSAPGSDSPQPPTSVLRSATKTFIPGLPVPAAGPAGMGLTQIFAGTLDDSQGGPMAGTPPLEPMPTMEQQFPDSQFSATAGEVQGNDMILDSQPAQTETQKRDSQTQGVQLHFSQSQVHGFDSLMDVDATQGSDMIELTQDAGYQDHTPLKTRFVEEPQSTVATVPLNGTPDEEVQNSPLVRKKGKLRRRGDAAMSTSTLPPTEIPLSPTAAPGINQAADATKSDDEESAFKLMQKAARRRERMQKKFDKKKSKANEMVHEQADESEDEYAGLGGADGESSSDEDEELSKEMIDDAAGNDVDEGKLAGFFADRERAADAAQVDKLFKDITTGMLRKRRRGGGNNDFDLSDSDDDGEARRRMKRRQFAKMQKALMSDERIGKIAENPRSAAFLKSIEDRNSDDEWDIGENFVEEVVASKSDSDSQSQGQQQDQDDQPQEESIPDSQPTNLGRKRSRMEDHSARLPPQVRRARDASDSRPTSISEVRRSLSSLLEEPNASLASVIPATEHGSDSEEERIPSSSDKENRGTRDQRNGAKTAIVDRINLKRQSSSTVSTGRDESGAPASRPAFAAPAGSAGAGGFKVPGLLRRATTNSLISNSSNGSGSGAAGGNTSATGPKAGEDAKLKKTAGKRSGINFFARENERRAAVAEAEKRREKRKFTAAEGRGRVVGGLFGGGKFE